MYSDCIQSLALQNMGSMFLPTFWSPKRGRWGIKNPGDCGKMQETQWICQLPSTDCHFRSHLPLHDFREPKFGVSNSCSNKRHNWGAFMDIFDYLAKAVTLAMNKAFAIIQVCHWHCHQHPQTLQPVFWNTSCGIVRCCFGWIIFNAINLKEFSL